MQTTPPEGGPAQPYRDRLTQLNVDSVATVAPADANDVTAGVAPRYGGPGTTRRADHAEQGSEEDDHEERRSPVDSHGEPLRVPRLPGDAGPP